MPLDINPRDVYISRNAMERARGAHPGFTVVDVQQQMATSSPMAPEQAATILRRPPASCTDRYYLTQDGRALMVVVDRVEDHNTRYKPYVMTCYAPLSEEGERIPRSGIFVTRHALERLRQHHPAVEVRGALALLARATPMDVGLFEALLQRAPGTCRDAYHLADDQRGIFVLANRPEQDQVVLITYIRLSETQRRLLR